MSKIEDTLAERGARYGSFLEHARICQNIKAAMMREPGWMRLDPDMKQCLEVNADKIARILNGDPTYVDNWHDIQGYAKLVEDRLVTDAAKTNGISEQELSELSLRRKSRLAPNSWLRTDEEIARIRLEAAAVKVNADWLSRC